jgi:alpha-galactosidase
MKPRIFSLWLLLLWVFLVLPGVVMGQIGSPTPSTPYTRQLLSAGNQSNAWVALGIIGTNQTQVTNWITDASKINAGTLPLARLSAITSNQLDVGTWQLATQRQSVAALQLGSVNLTNWSLLATGSMASVTALNNASNALLSVIVTNGGGGGSVTNLSTATNSGAITTNDFVHLRLNQTMRRAAGARRVMGAQLNPANSKAQVVAYAQYLASSGLVNAGYNYIQLNTGWATNRAVDGTLQASPYFPLGIPDLVAALKPYGVNVGLFMEGWPNGTTYDANGIQCPTTPATAYADARQMSGWGVTEFWCSIWPTLSDADREYMSEQLANGFDSGTAAAGGQSPVALFTAATPPFASWMPQTYNCIYFNADWGDFSTLGPLGWQQTCLTNLLGYQWAVGPQCTRFGPSCITHSLVSWFDTNFVRASFGLGCMAKWPLTMGSPTGFTADEINIFTNAAALAIYHDPVLVPLTIVSSNASGMVLSCPLGNGDVALGCWNLVTNATTDFSVSLSNVTATVGSVVTAKDVFDGSSTNVDTTLNCTVNTNGFTLWRLSPYVNEGMTVSTTNGNDVLTFLNGKLQTITPVPAFWDTDASNYLVGLSYGFDTPEATNVNNLVHAAKAHNWWTNCEVIYPIITQNDTSMVANLKNPALPGVTHSLLDWDTTGIWFDGTASYVDTQYVPATSATTSGASTNSFHLFAYVTACTPIATKTFPIGAIDGLYQSFIELDPSTNWLGSLCGLPYTLTGEAAVADQRGACLEDRISATTHTFYFRSASNTHSDGYSQNGLPSGPITLGAANYIGDSRYYFWQGTLGGVTIGSGMDSAKVALFLADWEAFETAMGRNFP